MTITDEMVAAARGRVRNECGEALAEKATAAFCLVFSARMPHARSAVMEDVSESGRAGAAILEFMPEPQRASLDANLLDALHGLKIVRAVVQTESAQQPELLPETAAAIRQVRINRARDAFLSVASPVRAQLERTALGRAAPGLEMRAFPQSVVATEVCWLNRSIKTWLNPVALAEVASDPAIARIDVPRRLEPDIYRTGGTVGAPAYRERFGRTGKGVKIAVIDSEVAIDHPALANRVIHRQNFTKEPWGTPDSHGTAIAGIAAAAGPEIVGMAPEATIYNYKVLATQPLLHGDEFDGAHALELALEDGAQIANCSWGIGLAGDGSSREARACDLAWSLGLTIVKSAGNRGPFSGSLTSPADAEGVLVVGATDQEGTAVQEYSSRGPAGNGRTPRPHVVAPGGIPWDGLWSTYSRGGFGDCGYGTSYAAAHVSGMLALLLEAAPERSPEDLRDLLLENCRALNGDPDQEGRGLFTLNGLL